MTAALQQFNYQHINCYAHMLQLAINEGLKECHEIINKAKILNNALVCRDKYRETLRHVQQLIINNNVQSNSKILEPIRDVPTRWNSTYAALQRLISLKNAIYSLIAVLKNDLNYTVRNDGNNLEILLYNFFDVIHDGFLLQNEMQIYATMLQIPTHLLNDPLYLTENPLIWWKLHHKALPIHAKQARKYLAITALSVPSERLFSDAGARLKPGGHVIWHG
ncbi:8527_t:CDS:2, partial [Ambispora gerdemannii]